MIVDVSPVANLTNLTVLHLDGNEIDDLMPVSDLKNLEDLDLQDNQIADIGDLTGLTNLSLLRLNVNPLSVEAYGVHIPELQSLGVVVTFE